ncbi:MAG: glycine zipper 2TM domain-containing protein [Bacteroidota bacterium]|nr:glycine zipper 2TM domain-containing protein [Bacteroidota bacterium]
MKNIFLVLSTTILFASCSQKPTANEQAEAEVKAATEMQEMQAWKEELATQPEIPQPEEKESTTTVTKKQAVARKQQPAYTPEPVKNTTPSPTPQNNSTTQNSSSGGGETAAPASQPAEPAATNEKTGISNTAKGAIIGGVVGAGTGALLNKKNRAAGAVVGGLVGAGTGAVIGNIADKKEQQKQ